MGDEDQDQGAGSTAGTEDPAAGAGDDGEQFPRVYVERLRGESRKYREQARTAQQRAGELSAALWQASVSASGRLADPEDLPMPEDADPTDPDTVAAAVDELLQRKPHLAARRAGGDIGQHDRTAAGDDTNLAAMLRLNA